MKKILLTICVVLFSSMAQAQTSMVLKAVNGDTLELIDGKIVHLIGVDAPENVDNEKAKSFAKRTGVSVEEVTVVGKVAERFLAELVEDEVVYLEYSDKKVNDEFKAYVYVAYPSSEQFQPRDGYHYFQKDGVTFLFVNATVIRSGYATPFVIPPDIKYAELFKSCMEDAKENQRGLWRSKK